MVMVVRGAVLALGQLVWVLGQRQRRRRGGEMREALRATRIPFFEKLLAFRRATPRSSRFGRALRRRDAVDAYSVARGDSDARASGRIGDARC